VKRLTDKDFIYVPAERTDLKKTFARIREQQRVEAEWRLKNAIDLKRKAK
jgi:hypothetical protein